MVVVGVCVCLFEERGGVRSHAPSPPAPARRAAPPRTHPTPLAVPLWMVSQKHMAKTLKHYRGRFTTGLAWAVVAVEERRRRARWRPPASFQSPAIPPPPTHPPTHPLRCSVVGFQPTGWTHERGTEQTRSRGRRRQKGTLITYQARVSLDCQRVWGGSTLGGYRHAPTQPSIRCAAPPLPPPPPPLQVPYSEHSSFTELREFVAWLRPLRCVCPSERGWGRCCPRRDAATQRSSRRPPPRSPTLSLYYPTPTSTPGSSPTSTRTTTGPRPSGWWRCCGGSATSDARARGW